MQFDVPSFSEFWITGNNGIILPLRLLRFDARAAGDDAILDWRTASEEGSDYFAVERSTDAQRFEEVGRMLAKGDGKTGENAYQYTDEFAFRAAHSDVLYYRLRQADKDGHAAYSDVRRVTAGATTQWMRIAPNPADQTVSITLSRPAVGDCPLTLINAVGQALRHETLPAGSSTYSIATSGLAGGVYYLELRSGGETLREKIVVRH